MSKYARIVDDKVFEVIVLPEGETPNDFFHPDIASEFVPATESADQAWGYLDGTFTPPVFEEIGV